MSLNNKRKKLKVKDYNKKYSINQSPLYKLCNLKKLSRLLNTSIRDINKLKNFNNSYYNVFINQDNREIQEPINEMYIIHNRIASLLSRIATPDYLHSFKKKHSYITNSKAHLSAKQVITFDIEAFYQNNTQNKLRLFFKEILKCSEDISFILSKVCTYNNHLPTGSQASVYLSYLVNIQMFTEMYNLASKQNVCMTVYADDITVSGTKVDMSILNTMTKIVERYNYTIKKEKTRRFLGSQIPIVTGVALCGNGIAPTNNKFKKLRHKSNFLIKLSNDLDIETLEEEYKSLNGTVNHFAQLDSGVPKNVLEAKSKLAKLLSE